MESRWRIPLGNRPTPKTPTSATNDVSGLANFKRIMEQLNAGVYGSVSDTIRDLCKRKLAEFSKRSAVKMDAAASSNVPDAKRIRGMNGLKEHHDVCCISGPAAAAHTVVILDSDEEDNGEDTANGQFQGVVQTKLEEQCFSDTEVRESIATSSPKHAVADDTAACKGDEAARTDIEPDKEKDKMNCVIPLNLCQDEKTIIDLETSDTQHADVGDYSVTSGAPAQAEETVVVLDLDENESDGSVVDMDISPLREVVLASQFGEFSAEKEVGDSIEIGILISESLPDGTYCKENGKSGSVADETGGKGNEADRTDCKEDTAVSNGEKNDDPMLRETGPKTRADDTNHKEDSVLDTRATNKELAFWHPEDDSTQSDSDEDGLGNLWNEMAIASKFTGEPEEYPPSNLSIEDDDDDRCDHDYIHKEDIGDVCRICGFVGRDITSVIDVQFFKAKKYVRNYASSSRNAKDKTTNEEIRVQDDDVTAAAMYPHPRHQKQMKPHQEEGFKFLCSNLVSDDPGGCILAHAPGSGKTFLIISFIQSFLARYPKARPLVVLPKSILHTWRKEFEKWNVEDFPIYDFYTSKAEGRAQQLEVLKKWVDQKSVLLLGYMQLSSIICDEGTTMECTDCQNILLHQPSLLVLDEGHTPRNEGTNVLQSLVKIRTPRKIVLSGTLYQNHVQEVFNVLKIVRPSFLKLNDTPSIVKRILSKASIPTGKKVRGSGADATFYEAVEHTLQQDGDFKSKVSLIQDLREMTRKVLHYFKGDFLSELPGLVDLTVVLKLTDWQKHEVEEMKKVKCKFTRAVVGGLVWLHPKLKNLKKKLKPAATIENDAMDKLLEDLDTRDGVKTKFFLNMLALCETNNEKMVIFSQYLPPLKFLERLLTKLKGWTLGREMFMISGDSSSEQRERSVEHFNNSTNAKVFFGSIKACGEGISLVGGSRVIILDVHLNPAVTRQAIGRAFRPGQTKVVYVYRLIAGGSPEEEDYNTCFRKEAISKLWFEWHEFCGFKDFKVDCVELQKCGDMFMESPLIAADVRDLHRR
ncbi:unnamed protein product [Linum trigynum]|uniref:Uncharacterized protein n=1 Tax=Linum trigynum TaxID=586398 RepID=A0AAV2EIU0_9ROSI